MAGQSLRRDGEFWSTMPADPDPASQLHSHLSALRRMLDERPELFTVTAELDLRARRDPAVRSSIDQYEAGWREALMDALSHGARAGVWAPAVRPEAAAELIIAAVKGARLVPELAGDVFSQLEALLAGPGSAPASREAGSPTSKE